MAAKPKAAKRKRAAADVNDVLESAPTAEAAAPEAPDASASQGTTTFAELGLHTWLAQQCAALKLRRPTPVQAQCVPEILKGALQCGRSEQPRRANYR